MKIIYSFVIVSVTNIFVELVIVHSTLCSLKSRGSLNQTKETILYNSYWCEMLKNSFLVLISYVYFSLGCIINFA